MSKEENKQSEMFALSEISEGALVPQNIAAAIENEGKKGRYTAERLKSKRPEVFNAVKALLGCGLSFDMIAELCKVSFYTVAAVSDVAAADIAAFKEKLARKMFTNAAVLQDAIREMAEKLDKSKPTTANIYQLAIAASALADKANLFSGGVTERVKFEGEDEYENPEDYKKNFLDNKAAKDADFEITDGK